MIKVDSDTLLLNGVVLISIGISLYFGSWGLAAIIGGSLLIAAAFLKKYLK